MEAELADGTILEFPDGTDPQVIQATVKKMIGAQARPEFDTTLTGPEKFASSIDKALTSDYLMPPAMRDMLPSRQNVVDLAAGASGLMRGGANLIKPGLGQQIWPTAAASEESGMRTLGSVVDPVALTIGGGVSKVLPYVPVLGKGAVEGAKALGQNILAGTTMGGAIGGLSEEGTVGEGAAMGATLAVALPLAVGTGKYIGKRIGEIADLFTPGGSQRIAKRYVNVIVGDKNKDVLAKALSNPKSYVAGSPVTAAEAVANIPAGSPLQAHQKLVSQEPGGISAQFGEVLSQKQAARDAALSFAGTEDDIQRLIVERTNAVKPLYEAVKTSTAQVKSMPVLAKVDKLLKENPNRTAIATPLSKIREALVVKTNKGSKLEMNPQSLKSLSDDIGDMMGKKTVTGQPEYDVKVLRDIKETLDMQIGKFVPEYQKAQAVFAEKSKPINVMQIGKSLKDKLTNPTGAETPGTYLRALDKEKKLLKESIGFGRKEIKDYLSPEQMANVENVAKDLERQIAANTPLQKTNLRGGINVAGDTTISLPNLLSRPAMLANYVVKTGGRNVEPEIDAYLSHLYRNPKELAKVMQKIPSAQRTAFGRAIKNYGRAGFTSATMNQDNQ